MIQSRRKTTRRDRGIATVWMSAALLVVGCGPSEHVSNAPASVSRTSSESVPLFSAEWFDDGGFSFVAPFAGPLRNSASLDELRSSLEHRGHRGAKLLQAKLDGLKASDPNAPDQRRRLNLMIGAMLMFEGEFNKAEARFRVALDADPSISKDLHANIEALIGIAALRRGEVENCVECRNESSCLFPISPEAIHLKPEGSRAAMGRFTNYLRQRPEDDGVRWLLNVAAMTVGDYPDGVPAEFRLSLEPFQSKVDIGRFPNVAKEVGLDTRGPAMAGGCVVEDFDGDGRLDLFTTTSDPSKSASLFRNQGDGRFEDRSESWGLAGQVASLNAAPADFDNDGDVDLILTRGAWESARRLSLLRNDGGTFVDVTIAAGLAEPIATQAAAWGDFDDDGFVDLYLAGEMKPGMADLRNRSRLYRNNGDGTFRDVALTAGVVNDRFGKGAAWGDFDDDGDLDLYVSNLGQANRLYRNNGDGTFNDVAEDLKVTEPISSFACWFWDFDNDGRLDLYVNPYGGNLAEIVRSHLGKPTTGERPRLYRNLGAKGGFEDVTKQAGLDRVLIPMGSNFGDLDNDGFLDFYLGTGKPAYSYLVPNVLFKNVDGRRFEDATTSARVGHLQKGHGVAFADWDGDGDLDIFLESGGATPGDKAHQVLFANPGHHRHWLSVRLVGVKTNRSAIGVKVKATVRGNDGKSREIHRVVGSGGSFGANPFRVHLGLNEATSLESLEIRWPTSRTTQTFRDLKADRTVEIVEGRPEVRELASPLRKQPD